MSNFGLTNMPFVEVQDAEGLARDVSGMGRWGNGEVEVGVQTEQDVAYALGLVRQALERQLSSVGDSSGAVG